MTWAGNTGWQANRNLPSLPQVDKRDVEQVNHLRLQLCKEASKRLGARVRTSNSSWSNEIICCKSQGWGNYNRLQSGHAHYQGTKVSLICFNSPANQEFSSGSAIPGKTPKVHIFVLDFLSRGCPPQREVEWKQHPPLSAHMHLMSTGRCFHYWSASYYIEERPQH